MDGLLVKEDNKRSNIKRSRESKKAHKEEWKEKRSVYLEDGKEES